MAAAGAPPHFAAIGIAADSLGGAQRTIEMAVDYSKVREQFGRKIGSFQAMKHIAAEMVADVEPARSLVWYAAYAWDRRPRDAARAAAMAKASLGDVYSRTARRSVEMHGGIGFTWEFDLQLWFKRAHTNEVPSAIPSFHRQASRSSTDTEPTPPARRARSFASDSSRIFPGMG
jgi:alkylation response protein AidB-like acyl-CoA dehydrogenase